MIKEHVSIPFEVIERFSLVNGTSLNESIKMHDDLVDYLDNAYLASESLSPSLLLDEVWHSFILHTKLYIPFCKERYNQVIHHVPLSKDIDLKKSILVKELMLEQTHINSGKCTDAKCKPDKTSKCDADKKDDTDSNKDKGKKDSGSCGAGKCGASK